MFDENQRITDHHAVDVELNDMLALEQDIVNTIKEAVAFLSTNADLFSLYTTTYSKY